MAMNQQGRIQSTTDRMIRKAGQLHGQDRKDYEAAKAQGRGQGFMRRFQNQAQQAQGQIAKEAAPLGYRPQQPQSQPQRPQQPQAPGRGQDLAQLIASGGQPMRPITQSGGGIGQQIDPGFNGWLSKMGVNPQDIQFANRMPQAGASVQGYPGVVNDMMARAAGGVAYNGGSATFDENARAPSTGNDMRSTVMRGYTSPYTNYLNKINNRLGGY